MEGDEIVFQHEEDGRRTGEYLPETAAADLKSLLEAGGARPPFGFSAQQIAIEQWAEKNGLWFDWSVISNGAQKGGVEHFVKPLLEQGRILKITIPPVFGRHPVINSAGALLIGDATPLECLGRWNLHNTLLRSDTRVAGVTAQKEGFPSFVFTQRYAEGPPPTIELSNDWFAQHGYERIPNEWIFYNPKERIALFDARPANLVWSEGTVVPVDVIPSLASEPMHRALLKMLDNL